MSKPTWPGLISARRAATNCGAQSPFNWVATPEEIAAAGVYLASPEAEWPARVVLDLNGAFYLR